MIPRPRPVLVLALALTSIGRAQDPNASLRELRTAIEEGSASVEQQRQYIDRVFQNFRARAPGVDEESVEVALILAEELEDGDRLASLHLALGYRRNDQGKYDDALRELRMAADLAESPKIRVWVLAALVDPCMQTHRFDEGRAAVEEARQVLASMAEPPREARLQVCLAEYRCWFALGLPDLCPGPLEELGRLAAEEVVHGDPAWAAVAVVCQLDW